MYHFPLTLSSSRAKLDDITYPFVMIYKDSLDSVPLDVLMNLKKGKKGIMQTSFYFVCTNKKFNKNNLYNLIVPYGIKNTIEKKIATNFSSTEQKIYTVTKAFIFAQPKIKLRS